MIVAHGHTARAIVMVVFQNMSEQDFARMVLPGYCEPVYIVDTRYHVVDEAKVVWRYKHLSLIGLKFRQQTGVVM